MLTVMRSQPTRWAFPALLAVILLLVISGPVFAQSDDGQQSQVRVKAQMRTQDKAQNQIRIRAQTGEKPLSTLVGPTAPLAVDQDQDRQRDGDHDGVPDLLQIRLRLRDCLSDEGILGSWLCWWGPLLP